MNYKYSEPEGRRLLTPVNPFILYSPNSNTFHRLNPPLIYDGKLKLEVGKTYPASMFKKTMQLKNKNRSEWTTTNRDEKNLKLWESLGYETRQVLTDAEPKPLRTTWNDTDAEMLDTSVKEGEAPHVILKSGSVYDNKLFSSLSQARNYVAMNNPKRKWKKSDNESEMVCALYGTKFIFQPLDVHK